MGLRGELEQGEAQRERMSAEKEGLEYAVKVMEGEGAEMREELVQLTGSKEKLVQLTREHQALEEQFATAKKHLELALADKDVNLKEMIEHYEEGKLRDHQQKVQQ